MRISKDTTFSKQNNFISCVVMCPAFICLYTTFRYLAFVHQFQDHFFYIHRMHAGHLYISSHTSDMITVFCPTNASVMIWRAISRCYANRLTNLISDYLQLFGKYLYILKHIQRHRAAILAFKFCFSKVLCKVHFTKLS